MLNENGEKEKTVRDNQTWGGQQGVAYERCKATYLLDVSGKTPGTMILY
jgi:hypothetical protein